MQYLHDPSDVPFSFPGCPIISHNGSGLQSKTLQRIYLPLMCKFEVYHVPELRNAHVLMTYEFERVTYLTHLYGWSLFCSLSICRYCTCSRDAQYIGMVNCRFIGPTPLLIERWQANSKPESSHCAG